MANVIKIKSDVDFTGSNGGKDIPCYVFDSEPTAEQQAECHANGISMQWANGSTREWNGMRDEDGNYSIGTYAQKNTHKQPSSSFEKFMFYYCALMAAIMFVLLVMVAR